MARVTNPEPKPNTSGDGQFWGVLVWKEVYCKSQPASLRDPGSIPGGGPKRFHDSFNIVFYIVGECISCAADTHLVTDLTC